jgi:membrane associated rhomboid family serine protease
MKSDPSEAFRALDFLAIFKTRFFFMFIIVFSVSSLLLCLPNLDAAWMASSQNIESAFTSVFVHRDFTHLIANITLSLVALLLYSISNTISGNGKDNFLILAVWTSAVLANLAYAKTIPYAISYGSSGLVSAFLSGVIIIAYLNAWTEPVPRVKVAQFAIGTFLLAAFVALNLDVDPDTNVAVHLNSFFYMAVLMLAKRFLSSFFSKTD